MPASILDRLPGEIRNEIFSLVVVSPTNFIQPVGRSKAYELKYPRSTSASGPHFYLKITNPSSISDEEASIARNGLKTPPPPPTFISTSLLRLSKRLGSEAASLFWAKNTFVFSSTDALSQFAKQAGYLAFGKITKLSIAIDDLRPKLSTSQPFRDIHALTRLASTLSQAKKAPALTSLSLTISSKHIKDIHLRKHSLWLLPLSPRCFSYETLLSGFRALKNTLPGSCVREIVVFSGRGETSVQFPDTRDMVSGDEIMGDFVGAFGGKMKWGETLVWDGGEKVLGDVKGLIWEGMVETYRERWGKQVTWIVFGV
ncbi:hypothetical protein BDZ45DRAFT_686674 [Acephala macrosclerotiorum]|nr:hypothetical protein BDZ45DRAFT_686674 [Acephala macrosclerotiorum]